MSLPPSLADAVRCANKRDDGPAARVLAAYGLDAEDKRLLLALAARAARRMLDDLTAMPPDNWPECATGHLAAQIIKGISYGVELERLRNEGETHDSP